MSASSFYNNSPGIVTDEAPAEEPKPDTLLDDAPPAAEPEPQPFAAPENILELRRDQFFDGAKTFAQEINIESPEVEPELLQSFNNEVRRMVADVGLSSMEAKEFASLAKAHSANPPDDTQQETWRAETLQAVQRQYGARAHEALELAQKLVSRDARTAAILDAGHMGNHPRVCLALIEKAYSERAKGRLN